MQQPKQTNLITLIFYKLNENLTKIMDAILGQFLILVEAFEDAAHHDLRAGWWSLLELQLEEPVVAVEEGFKYSENIFSISGSGA